MAFPPSLTHCKILVVEPQLVRRQALRQLLAEAGAAQVVLASSGQEAALELASGLIGLVFTNWKLPDMSGLDMINMVKGDGLNRGVPVVLLGENIPQQQKVQAVKAGVAGQLSLPVTRQGLEEVLALVAGE